MTEKLQKVLARFGLGSRREMEEAISQGRVSVNGSVARLGDRVDSLAEIRLDGRKLESRKYTVPCRVILYHKPEGELCTRKDPQGRPTVFDRSATLAPCTLDFYWASGYQHIRFIAVYYRW